ncbi:MAG: hypothetical protein LH660_13420 [Phormidesmis sp. CAN_BIN36]|nr:hypothetical protein [Phormidesmis sp. CAN_BIN36]
MRRSPPQPFLERRELEFLSPLLGERARVRAAKDSSKKIIFLLSNAHCRHWLDMLMVDRDLEVIIIEVKRDEIGLAIEERRDRLSQIFKLQVFK